MTRRPRRNAQTTLRCMTNTVAKTLLEQSYKARNRTTAPCEKENKQMLTPWGESDSVIRVGDEVALITTPRHGGILVSEPALSSVPQPVRNCMLDQENRRMWAEEDVEMHIVLAILLEAGRLDQHTMEQEFPAAMARDENDQPKIRHEAREICQKFQRYAPCLQFLNQEVKP